MLSFLTPAHGRVHLDDLIVSGILNSQHLWPNMHADFDLAKSEGCYTSTYNVKPVSNLLPGGSMPIPKDGNDLCK